MERFHLPKNYYKSVHPMVTVATITTIWGILPVLAFFPNSMDWIIPDPIDDYIEDFHYKLIKLWNVFLWAHMIMSIVAIQRCRKLGIGPSCTLKWIFNVWINGFFALRYLIWPSENVEHIKVH